MRDVRLSPQAARDLEAIGDFIARDSPARAISFVEEVWEKCQSLSRTPQAYPVQTHLGPGIRRAVHQRYLVFYTVRRGEVRIERILHGARDINQGHFRS